MGKSAMSVDDLRAQIISQPDVILEDLDVMRALVAANERAMGDNVVDLRGVAMERLEARLDRLEETHRSVISAAYDNLASTSQVHRVVLHLLEAADFGAFLHGLQTDVAAILQVDSLRLVLEAVSDGEAAAAGRFGDVLLLAEPGFIDTYLGRRADRPSRQIGLRALDGGDSHVYGAEGQWLRSEACLRLDLGRDRLPGLLALGAEDRHRFSPSSGTDLLSFFAGVFERSLRRWLS
ncbi:MAG: DUF484 family protein [Tranquillimonas sp.]